MLFTSADFDIFFNMHVKTLFFNMHVKTLTQNDTCYVTSLMTKIAEQIAHGACTIV